MISGLSRNYPKSFYSGLFVAGILGISFAALGIAYLNLSRNNKIYFSHRWPLISMPFGLTIAAISSIVFSLSKCKERPEQRYKRIALAAKELGDLLEQPGSIDNAVQKLKEKHRVDWEQSDKPLEQRVSAAFNDLWQMRDRELIKTLEVVCSPEGLPQKIRELLLSLSLFYRNTADLPDAEDVAKKWIDDRSAIIRPYLDHCNLLLLNERFLPVVDCLSESFNEDQVKKLLDQFP